MDAHIRPARERLSVLERGLRLFTDVRPGEGVTGVVMFADVFLVLCAYYCVKAGHKWEGTKVKGTCTRTHPG